MNQSASPRSRLRRLWRALCRPRGKAMGRRQRGAALLTVTIAIAVIGALCISVLLSLVATPTVYFILRRGSKNA